VSVPNVAETTSTISVVLTLRPTKEVALAFCRVESSSLNTMPSSICVEAIRSLFFSSASFAPSALSASGGGGCRASRILVRITDESIIFRVNEEWQPAVRPRLLAQVEAGCGRSCHVKYVDR
jgi:hypothetical protein